MPIGPVARMGLHASSSPAIVRSYTPEVAESGSVYEIAEGNPSAEGLCTETRRGRAAHDYPLVKESSPIYKFSARVHCVQPLCTGESSVA